MFISSCTQSRADFFLQSWFEVYRDFSPPLEAPWRNSANWFNSCLVPLSVPTVNCRKCLHNSAGKSFNKGEEGLGRRPFAFWSCLFFHPHSLTSPLWEDHTTLRAPKKRKRKWVLLLWPSMGLGLLGSLTLDMNWDPSLNWTWTVNLFCTVLFLFLLHQKAREMFWGTWKASLDRQSFLRFSGTFSPLSPCQLQHFADLW